MAELPTEMEGMIRQASCHVRADWSSARASTVLSQIKVTQVRRRRQQVAGSLLVMICFVAGVLLWGHGAGKTQVAARIEPSIVQLTDGSLAQALDAQSQLQLVTTQPDRVLIRLRGAASFQVQKNPRRLYRVETERVAVEVLGTRFVVKELPNHKVHVEVSEGRVRVLWNKQQRELSAGTGGDFPEADAQPVVRSDSSGVEATARFEASSVPEATSRFEPSSALDPRSASALPSAAILDRPSAEVPLPGPVAPIRSAKLPAPQSVTAKLPSIAPVKDPVLFTESWQSLAEQGKFEQAYTQAFVHGASRDGELDPAELLLLADVARFSGHPSDAVPPLQRLLRSFPSDPRSPLGSFTLGRIWLDDLGQPRQAAASFHHVGELDPEGPLTQDALGREVEAWSRAGEQSLARSRAEEYVRRYPSGRRLRSVKRYGALD
ncbi:MAG: FecR domain-containing protein [Myxococcales bacterium]|nr:FecR domain-containing protein [Myxococcales bacterium]